MTTLVMARDDEVLEARPSRLRYLRTPGAIAALAVILGWCVLAVIWPSLVPHDPFATSLAPSFAPPSAEFWLGTDNLGRDVFSRLLAGSTDVLSIAPPAAATTMVVGTVLGLIAATVGGWVDGLIMRVMELFLVLPAMVLAIMVLSALGPSRITLLLVIAQFGIPSVARTTRIAALREVHKDYVTAAQMRGENLAWITLREILPNLTSVLLVESTVRLSWAFFSAASLSFLGISLQPPSADWGLTITTQRIFLQVQPWAALAPTLALASLMVAAGVLANRLGVAAARR
jgi:peptide/nickel transport system permease protein